MTYYMSKEDILAKLDWEGFEYIGDLDPAEMEDRHFAQLIIQYRELRDEIEEVLKAYNKEVYGE